MIYFSFTLLRWSHLSDVTDLQSAATTLPISTIAFESSSLRPANIANQARKLSVGPTDIVGVAGDMAGGGLKVISGVVDSSYKMLGGLGSRLWGGSDLSLNSTGSGVASSASSVASASGTTTLVVPGLAVMEEMKNAVVSRVAGATAVINGELEKQKELKDMGSGTGPGGGGGGSESVGFVGMPNFIESRASSQRVGLFEYVLPSSFDHFACAQLRPHLLTCFLSLVELYNAVRSNAVSKRSIDRNYRSLRCNNRLPARSASAAVLGRKS